MDKKEAIRKKEALQWFVDFANMKLDGLKPGDKAKLLVESEEYLSPVKDLQQIGLWPPQADTAELMYKKACALGDKSAEVFKKVTDLLSWAAKIPKIGTPEYWLHLNTLQQTVRETFEEWNPQNSPGISGFARLRSVMIITTRRRTFSLSYLIMTKGPEEDVQFRLFRLLEGFPSNAIQKCQDCEKFFLNPSFRKKTFCSSRCASRFISRKRRETDPEAYRKYQKAVMKDKRRKDKGLTPRRFYKPKEQNGPATKTESRKED